MFGYVRPLQSELKVRELDDYKAVYCGLCRTMGKRFGLLARMTLNYDFTFLAMVLAWGADPCTMEMRRCPVHPLSRRNMCENMPALIVAADESVILTYRKFLDDVADKSFLKGFPTRVLTWVFRPSYKKAARLRPEFDEKVTSCLRRISDLEKENCASIDYPADAFAQILQAAAPETGDTARDRALAQLLYHVGRWIYLVDAWDDLEEDIKKGRYNPMNMRFEGKAFEHIQDVRVTLLHSRNLASSAYELAKAERWDSILSNIIYLGLPAVEELVLTGRWQKKRRKIS